MIAVEPIFVLIALLTMAGAMMTVLAGSIIRAVLGLVVTMFGIAGLYIYLSAPFLAMMQILVYVGAVTILIAFAVMLAGPMYKKPKEWGGIAKFAGGLVVSLLSLFLFFKLVMGSFGTAGSSAPFTITTKDLGRALFDVFTLPFELISLLIVVSIVGSIMLALLSKGEK